MLLYRHELKFRHTAPRLSPNEAQTHLKLLHSEIPPVHLGEIIFTYLNLKINLCLSENWPSAKPNPRKKQPPFYLRNSDKLQLLSCEEHKWSLNMRTFHITTLLLVHERHLNWEAESFPTRWAGWRARLLADLWSRTLVVWQVLQDFMWKTALISWQTCRLRLIGTLLNTNPVDLGVQAQKSILREGRNDLETSPPSAAEDALKRVSSRRKTPPDVVNVGQLLPTCILGSAYLFHKHVQYIPHLAPPLVPSRSRLFIPFAFTPLLCLCT